MIFLTVKHGLDAVDTAEIGDEKVDRQERNDSEGIRMSKARITKWLQDNEYELRNIRDITCEFDNGCGHHMAVVDLAMKAKKKA